DNVSLLTHEMKSPLAAIRGAGEILHDEISDPSLTRFTDNVIHESQRLSDLLDRLLAMAKLEKLESLPARKSRVTISALVEDWQSSRYSLLAEKHLEVSVNDGVLQAEAETLKLALFNLLDNALRFANAETTLTVQVEGDSLTVENIGPAIPDYALDRVTERFYSLPAPGHDKSSGLGLTMVAEIASLHGGSLILTNTNNGVRATLTIPQN
ncbi:ATP-binding protein, partial [uncultured Alcanivorax sp.]